MKFLLKATAALSWGSALCAAAPAQWRAESRSPPSALLEFTVAVKQNAKGLAALEDTVQRVSDPTHPDYTQYLSHDEVAAMVAPPAASVDAVVAWLRAELGPSAELRFSPSKDFVEALVTVAQAERLLGHGTEYRSFRHTEDGRVVQRVAAETLVLPAQVRDHVDFVSPTTTFPGKRVQLQQSSREGLGAGYKTDPGSIRQLYNMGDVQGSGRSDNIQQVASFLNNSFDPTDLQLFFKTYYNPGTGRTVEKVFGPNDAGNPTIEASLDVQYLMSVGANVTTQVWYTLGGRPYPAPGGTGENEPFLKWLTGVSMMNDTELPKVMSVSYADEEYVIDPVWQARCEVEFTKLAARGTSLLFGSGDDGVTGDKGTCMPGNKFVPWWPATSPHVTSVGATEAFNPLQGASFSGGGFSNVYPTQSWQKDAVATYLQNAGLPPASSYNATGRAFPDVSAIGMNFWIYCGGLPTEVGGTSAATPTFAGIISLLNDARLAAGKKQLGFLNPLLYAHPEVFTDIVNGHNTGMGGCQTGGFDSVKGWDAVTGLGTPLYDKMLKLVMSLP